MPNLPRRVIGLFLIVSLVGVSRADEPTSYAQLCLDYVHFNKDGRRELISNHIDLKPDELASLLFQVEATGTNAVRVRVRRRGPGPSGFKMVRVISKIVGENPVVADHFSDGDTPFEVTAERVIVCYDKPDRWWTLTSAKGAEAGQLLVDILASEKKAIRAKRFTAKYEENGKKMSVMLVDVTE